MFSLKVFAFATTQIGMLMLVGMVWPNLFDQLSTRVKKRLEDGYGRDAPSIWLQRLSSALERFAKLVANPPEWLWPVSILGFLVGTVTLITPLGGFLDIIIIVIGYRKPELLDWMFGKEKNFFRGPRWWQLINLPIWAKLFLVTAMSLILGIETHPGIILLIGLILTMAAWRPKILDSLGSWNIACTPAGRFIGVVMFLLGIGWTIHSFKFEMIVVIGAIGYFVIKNMDLIEKIKGWLQPATR